MIAVIAIGSNQGDRLTFLKSGFNELKNLKNTSVLRASKIYQTAPEGGVAEQPFLNAVVEVATEYSAIDLLRNLQEIEKNNQRVRTVKWADRTLDLDLIDYAGEEIETVELTLPHPLAHERGFVLLPWLEINPKALLPRKGLVKDIVKSKEFLELEFYAEF